MNPKSIHRRLQAVPSILLSMSLLTNTVACQKTPVETPKPVTMTYEETSPVVETTPLEEGVEEAPSIEVSAEDESKKLELQEILFADQVNDAVALLTVDAASAEKGLAALEKLRNTRPDVPEITYNIGVAHLKLGNEKAAEKAFNQTIDLDPTFAKAWVNLGVLLERNRKYDQAIAMYERGLSYVEQDPDLTAGKVACLRKQGKLDEAVIYAQAVLGKNANNILAYSEVGEVYLEQGDLDKALFVLQRALARNGSENARLQSVLGKVYYAQEKIPLAEQAFRKSLSLDPTLIETSMYLSFLQLENRAWAAADETLEAALALDPTNAALLNAQGIAKRGLGEIDEAERLYRQAFELNPNNPEPLLNLAVLEADYRNEYGKAYALLDRYVDEGGDKKDLVDTWREDFKKSEANYLQEKKQQELRELFKRRREEQAKKKAEEEARLAEEAKNAEQNPEADEDGTDTEGEPDETGEPEEIEGSTGEENATNETDSEDSTVEEGETVEDQVEEPLEATQGENSENSWEGSTSSESQSESGDSEEADGGKDEETTTESVDDAGGWGTDTANLSCSTQPDCQDGMICSSEGTCKYLGEYGTLQEGQECTETAECANSLECSDAGVCQAVSE